MAYPSVDRLQKILTKEVFHYAKDAKKAAGRALGTLVELIAFYSLKSWGLERQIAIERPLPEFANLDITHNVEYSLHPSRIIKTIEFPSNSLPITPRKIVRHAQLMKLRMQFDNLKSAPLLSKDMVLRNSCAIAESGDYFFNAYLDSFNSKKIKSSIIELHKKPFAIFECKRVGVEEGNKKGPQTIEKAKQGAYVARAVSSLQKIRFLDGQVGGFIQKKDGSFYHKEYYQLLNEIINTSNAELLVNFILTVGVVSNHGNWFTLENHNKELKVLAQSYDWLLFLTDRGIAQFIDELLLNPKKELKAAREIFLKSYTGKKGVNQFTKVQIALSADSALQYYFNKNIKEIEGWYNIITPARKGLNVLKQELDTLKNKNWREIHS